MAYVPDSDLNQYEVLVAALSFAAEEAALVKAAALNDVNAINNIATNGVTSTELSNALTGYQATLVSGTNIKSINNNSLVGAGDLTIDKTAVGLGNVDNTSDASKPISTLAQTALNGKAALKATDTVFGGAKYTLVGNTLTISIV